MLLFALLPSYPFFFSGEAGLFYRLVGGAFCLNLNFSEFENFQNSRAPDARF